MLKSLHKDDTQTIPFVATKDWELSNVTNGDLVLMEHSGSDGPPVALEYLEYSPYSPPYTSSACDIALEQQSLDLASTRDGLNVTGLFYPNIDPQNSDGTYQRMVYSQISNMFYNNYRDPTKIWGIEKIDFDLSQTKRFISDKFKLFDISPSVFGEKMLQNSVILYDTTTDNNYTITDDGNCNLFAGINLFSKQQELGEYSNVYASGSNAGCDLYNSLFPPNIPIIASTLVSNVNICATWNNIFTNYNVWETPWGYCGNCSDLGILVSWNINEWPVINYVIERSTDGITYTIYQTLGGGTTYFLDTNISASTTYFYEVYAENLIGTSSVSNVTSQSLPPLSIYWNTDSDYWNENKICGPVVWSNDPVTPVLTANAVSYNSASLSWSVASSPQPINGFVLQRSTDGGITFTTLQTLPSSQFSTIDTPINTSSLYVYDIYSYNTFGNSAPSNTASVYIINDFLIDINGNPYTAGPYDTFEGYSTGSAPNSGGHFWGSAWNITALNSANYAIGAEDDFSSYSSSYGQPLSSGSNGGWGWLPFTGSGISASGFIEPGP